MQLHIFFVIQLVFKDVIDNGVQKSDVRTWPDTRVDIRNQRRPVKARVDVDDDRAALLRLTDPLHRQHMIFGNIAAFNEEYLGVLHVRPVIRHRAAAKGGPQTGDRGAVSKSGLMLYVRSA
ncbi:MAG: hypothetical protein BWY57_00911 [Betaproteobacteria bacterium ADurb.Bin341]|nr:MAG: hypothetical protein BWY57_00911 [Betaproteobacteria bacterium ADurb.Bin341]